MTNTNENAERCWGRVKSWQKLFPLAQRSISAGSFDIGRRVLESHRNAFNDFESLIGDNRPANSIGSSYHGERIEESLAFCYEQLGQFSKAALRYEEIDAPYAAALAYERAGNLSAARWFFEESINHYQGKRRYLPKLLEGARAGLRRLEEAE